MCSSDLHANAGVSTSPRQAFKLARGSGPNAEKRATLMIQTSAAAIHNLDGIFIDINEPSLRARMSASIIAMTANSNNPPRKPALAGNGATSNISHDAAKANTYSWRDSGSVDGAIMINVGAAN